MGSRTACGLPRGLSHAPGRERAGRRLRHSQPTPSAQAGRRLQLLVGSGQTPAAEVCFCPFQPPPRLSVPTGEPCRGQASARCGCLASSMAPARADQPPRSPGNGHLETPILPQELCPQGQPASFPSFSGHRPVTQTAPGGYDSPITCWGAARASPPPRPPPWPPPRPLTRVSERRPRSQCEPSFLRTKHCRVLSKTLTKLKTFPLVFERRKDCATVLSQPLC